MPQFPDRFHNEALEMPQGHIDLSLMRAICVCVCVWDGRRARRQHKESTALSRSSQVGRQVNDAPIATRAGREAGVGTRHTFGKMAHSPSYGASFPPSNWLVRPPPLQLDASFYILWSPPPMQLQLVQLQRAGPFPLPHTRTES